MPGLSPQIHTTADQRKAEREEAEVHQKAASGPHIVFLAIREEGEQELSRPSVALACSGFAAGLSMGFSLITEGLLRSHLPAAPWRPLICKFGYSIGFLIVILGRQQLFTENTLTPILPLLEDRTWRKFFNVLRLWTVVLISNLIGTVVLAWVLARTSAFPENVRQTFLNLGLEALDISFGTVFLRAIFAGWLIALMVWLLPVAEVARVWVIIILTYIVGLGRLPHVVAGSVEVNYVVAAGHATWTAVFGGWILPTLLGNIVGGVSLVAALNYAQVKAGKES